MGETSVLKRSVGKLDILSLAVGSIIGWGAFVMPGDLFIPKIGLINTFIGLTIGAIIMIITEKNFGFLLTKNQVSGGEFAFSYKAFGRNHALFCGWFLTLSYMSVVPLNATALSLVGKTMFPGIIKGYLYNIGGYEVYLSDIILTTFILILFGWFNIKGIKVASFFQRMMILFLVGIVFFLGSFFTLSSNFDSTILLSNFSLEEIKVSNILRILIIAPWAYQGFDCIPQAVEEFNFDVKKSSKLAVISIIVGYIIYNILNIITSSVFVKEVILKQKINWATGQAVNILFGKIGFYCLGFALLMAIIGGVNGYYVTASRLIYSMSRAKALPSFFSKLNKEARVPKNAIIFIMLFSLATPWFGRSILLEIVNMSAIGATIGYSYTSWAAFIEAKKEKNKFIIITGVIAGVSHIIFMSTLLIPNLETSLSLGSYIALLIWMILGIIFYKLCGEEYKSLSRNTLDQLILKVK